MCRPFEVAQFFPPVSWVHSGRGPFAFGGRTVLPRQRNDGVHAVNHRCRDQDGR